MKHPAPAGERKFDPYRLDGVGFVVVMAAVVFLGRENPNFAYPDILWSFAALLLFNLLTIKLLLPGDLAGTRRLALSVGVNLGLLTAVVEYSGGRESYLWIGYLLPVFHGCVFFTWRGILAVTAGAAVLLALPYTAYFHARLWGGLVELLVKAVTIVLAAVIISRIARQERTSRVRLTAEQRKMEREREQTQAQLRHMDRLATMGTLTASVAHEINTPLASILGHAQLALRGSLSERDARDAMIKIEKAVLRCKETIQNMLSFARRGVAERKPADFNGLVKECVKLVRVDWIGADLEVVEEYGSGIPPAFLSRAEIQQVLLNLLVNARQAIESGKGRGVITVSTCASDGEVLVTVSDSGPGIPAEVMGRIWEPFFTTKAAGKGTGLGLAICKQIVEGEGGRISVESSPGKGAAFMVRLPVAPDLPGTEDKSREACGPGDILVAEDDPAGRELLNRLLGVHGRPVVLTKSFDEALARILEQPPALLVTDLNMPGMSALDFFRNLEHRGLTARFKVLVVSGSPPGSALKDVMDGRGYPQLHKPFDIKAFEEASSALLAGKKA
ncbi:MAG: response regulator [Elusimicrobia bacterium]|nr:response regulator [Elusimicrobiota bacterium]